MPNDVGLIEDMCFLLKNMIAAEDHAAISFGITNDKKWVDSLNMIRQMRTKWLDTIVKKEKSHIYCFSKHILACAEGLIEIGNRFNSSKQIVEAKEAYEDANRMISLFLHLNEHSEEEDKEK